MEKFFKNIKILFFSRILFLLYKVLGWTWRTTEDAFPSEALERIAQGKPVVFAHLHGDEWALLHYFSGRPMSVLVSHSEDGSLMAEFIRKLGFRVLRGSSSKGAVEGFLGLLRSIKKNPSSYVSLAVDGPRGPRGKPKPGIMKLSEALHSPILVVGAEATTKWIFKNSWSQAFIPKLFSRVHVSYRLLEAVKKGTPEEQFLGSLEESLQSAKSMAFKTLSA